MSMLAERRGRKGYNIVPRGKPLFQDENHFGTRMLKKMGWTEGKGLGANEDGDVEFVRVKYKNDSVGFGYEDRDDQWTQHEEFFNKLLQFLDSNDSTEKINFNQVNSENEMVSNFSKNVGFGFSNDKTEKLLKDTLSGESLEEKSKKSKVRVHYKKFTKQKDISQYSEEDLANIFGKKFENQTKNMNKEKNQVNNCTLNYNLNFEESNCSLSKERTSIENGNLITNKNIVENFEDRNSNINVLESKSENKNSADEFSNITNKEIKISMKKKRKLDLENKLENISDIPEKINKVIDQLEYQQQEQEHQEKLETYKTSAYILELFSYFNFDQFKESNVKDIFGYGFDNNVLITANKNSTKKLKGLCIDTEKNDKYKLYEEENKKRNRASKK